jgi:amino acid adenylation domain-containing protein
MKEIKEIEDLYTLSPMQQGMIFHSLYSPESGVYLTQTSCTLCGNLNIPAFEKAWQRVIEKHQILRTSFYWENLDKPLQQVHRQVQLRIEQQDWCGISSTEQKIRMETYLKDDRELGFELSQPPLMRLALIQIDNDKYQFIWSHSDVLLDGWSLPILLKEVFILYEAFCKERDLNSELVRPYRDYIKWLKQQDPYKAEKFWREGLKNFTTPTTLMTDRTSDSLLSQGKSYEEQQLKLSVTTTKALQSLSLHYQLTLSTIVQAAWGLLLSNYTNKEDVVFGTVVSGRPPTLPGIADMVGLFINTVPVRIRVSSEDSILSWLRKLQEEQIELRHYEYSSLVEIQGWSEVPRGLPLFESIVIFENYPMDVSMQELGGNVEITNICNIERIHYPLTVWAFPGSELTLQITYDCNRFNAATITRILSHFVNLLEGIATNAKQNISSLSLLTRVEREQILVEWNSTYTTHPVELFIHQLFEVQSEQKPDALALIFEDDKLTYQELNDRANQLARYLRSLGVKPDVQVGICLERSLEMVIGLLAILKAGGAYVPLDPEYPQERLAFMLQNSQVPVLLTQQQLVSEIPSHSAKVVCLDTDWNIIAQQSTQNLITELTADNLINVIYTSGSTGKPKGVMNTHRGICNRLLWMQNTYKLTETDRVLQKTPFSFDVSVWEFFWPLSNGACLVVARPGGHKDTAYMVKLIAKEKVTTMHFVPSMLNIFLEEQDLKSCSCLKQVMCSGEAFPFDLQKRFFTRLGAKIHNLYGPTEAAIDVTTWLCRRDYSQLFIPIGRPIANVQIYILNSHLQAVPVEVPGELCISGVALARGYLNSPDLTAEKFIPNPFSVEPGERLYKTGDLACYMADGNIKFLGRIDDQVKLHGFRIELGEIEAVLSQHSSIRETVVQLWEDIRGDKRLIAYITTHQEYSVTANELRYFLKDKLPEYMVPSAFMVLDALPLTHNGKVDRSSLPIPTEVEASHQVAFVAPRNPIEEKLVAIWKEVLGLKQVGIYEDFLDTGGHSLLATLLVSRVREAFQVELPLRSLFEKSTIANQALFITQYHDEQKYDPIDTISKIARGSSEDSLAELSHFSDEEVDSLLETLLDE